MDFLLITYLPSFLDLLLSFYSSLIVEYERLFGIKEDVPIERDPKRDPKTFLLGVEPRSSLAERVGSSIYYPLSLILIPNSSTHPILLK